MGSSKGNFRRGQLIRPSWHSGVVQEQSQSSSTSNATVLEPNWLSAPGGLFSAGCASVPSDKIQSEQWREPDVQKAD